MIKGRCGNLDINKRKRKIKRRYDETAGIYDKRYMEIQVKKFQSIYPYLKKADRVLDIGCGTGLLLNKISKFSDVVFGIDFSMNSLERARERSRKSFLICADADKLPFKDSVFDIVVSITLLQNMPQPQITISEMRRVVIENGIVILSTLEKKHSIMELDSWFNSIKLKPMQIKRISDSEDILCVARRIK